MDLNEAGWMLSELPEHATHQLIPIDSKMFGDRREDARQSSDTKGVVSGNRDVMLGRKTDCEAEMAPSLPRGAIAQPRQSLRELIAGDIARQSQTAMISSRV
jgi:hypothetical protein